MNKRNYGRCDNIATRGKWSGIPIVSWTSDNRHRDITAVNEREIRMYVSLSPSPSFSLSLSYLQIKDKNVQLVFAICEVPSPRLGPILSRFVEPDRISLVYLYYVIYLYIYLRDMSYNTWTQVSLSLMRIVETLLPETVFRYIHYTEMSRVLREDEDEEQIVGKKHACLKKD